jgi:hypothetical protein
MKQRLHLAVILRPRGDTDETLVEVALGDAVMDRSLGDH